jgi:hypothetical protein
MHRILRGHHAVLCVAAGLALHHSDLLTAPSTHAGHNYIGTEHILLGLLREGEGVAARVLETLGADPSKIRTQVIRMVGESQEAVGAGVGGTSSGTNKMPTLEEYGTNLTTQAEEVSSAVQQAGSARVLCAAHAVRGFQQQVPSVRCSTEQSRHSSVDVASVWGARGSAQQGASGSGMSCRFQAPLGCMVAQQHHTPASVLLDSGQSASRTAAQPSSRSAADQPYWACGR